MFSSLFFLIPGHEFSGKMSVRKGRQQTKLEEDDDFLPSTDENVSDVDPDELQKMLEVTFKNFPKSQEATS